MQDDELKNLGGMTVNERLFTTGLLSEFDAAARRRDRQAMIELLKRVALSSDDASACAETILADPKRYGY